MNNNFVGAYDRDLEVAEKATFDSLYYNEDLDTLFMDVCEYMRSTIYDNRVVITIQIIREGEN